MIYDWYSHLKTNQRSKGTPTHWDALVSGFVDECTLDANSTDKKVKSHVRETYQKTAANSLKDDAIFHDHLNKPDFTRLPSSDWIALQIQFTLQTPWFSKDDRPLHVFDNPIRKDWVFGVPCMSATSWKGLLRWACRMQAGVIGPEAGSDSSKSKDDSWIIHLFGNEKSEKANFRAGALVFYPTFFNRIGFEVINPHDRARRAVSETGPITYEVVPEGAEGTLNLLYAPLSGREASERKPDSNTLSKLVYSITDLLEAYGISAKRTAGWGTAQITNWKAFQKDNGSICKKERSAFVKALEQWTTQGGSDE